MSKKFKPKGDFVVLLCRKHKALIESKLFNVSDSKDVFNIQENISIKIYERFEYQKKVGLLGKKTMYAVREYRELRFMDLDIDIAMLYEKMILKKGQEGSIRSQGPISYLASFEARHLYFHESNYHNFYIMKENEG